MKISKELLPPTEAAAGRARGHWPAATALLAAAAQQGAPRRVHGYKYTNWVISSMLTY